MLSAVRLPIRFAAPALQQDLAQFTGEDWMPHFNTSYYEGDWSGIALRSVGGVARQLYPDPTARQEYADTSNLDLCPNARAALATFECPLLAARYLRLGAGASIREHKDFNLGYEDGEVRVHVPVQSNLEVEFVLEGRAIEMGGEAWYLDLNLPHAVANRGTEDRIHLVVDCVVNDWLRSLLEAGEPATPA